MSILLDENLLTMNYFHYHFRSTSKSKCRFRIDVDHKAKEEIDVCREMKFVVEPLVDVVVDEMTIHSDLNKPKVQNVDFDDSMENRETIEVEVVNVTLTNFPNLLNDENAVVNLQSVESNENYSTKTLGAVERSALPLEVVLEQNKMFHYFETEQSDKENLELKTKRKTKFRKEFFEMFTFDRFICRVDQMFRWRKDMKMRLWNIEMELIRICSVIR